MDIKHGAKIAAAHGGAFNMPSRSPIPPRTLPTWGLIIGRFPQNEIGWVLLIGSNFNPSAGEHLILIAPGKMAIIGKAAHFKQHVPLNFIGMPFIDQMLDDLDHLTDMMRCSGLNIGG